MSEYPGDLYIFVDKPEEPGGAPFFAESDDVFNQRNVGEPLWYLNGWAVGNNPKSQYCARTSTSKLRSFAIFSEAMDFVRKRRKARPNENFYLVYVAADRKFIVNSLEEIQQLDQDRKDTGNPRLSDLEQRAKLETLTARVGKIVATSALALLRVLVEEGEAAARARFSMATYSRLWQALRDAELVEGTEDS